MSIRDLREHLGVRQIHLAPLLGMTQSELSKFERREDHRMSTLRRVVEALGGELQIIVQVGDESIKLTGV